VKFAVQPRPRAVIAALTTLLLAGGGLTLGVSAASAAPGDVAAGTLQWGFKQSFRNYITGPIAHGKWTVDAVTDATPFGWTAGSGDADDSTGSVSYPGSIHFQGHLNATTKKYDLDLDLSGVTLERTGADTATIVVDVVTNSLADPEKYDTFTDVEFASVDLGAATDDSTDTTIAFSAAPTVLTAAGAEAFSGFYEAGTALDPIAFSWPVEQATDPTDPTDPEPQPDVATITVSKARNLDRSGETLTITGKNFVADGEATDATSGALEGGFGGAYVAFGRYPSAWKPSAGAASADRPNGDVKLLVNADDVEKAGGAENGVVALNADGSFETTLDVRPGYFSEPSSGTYGIYTYGGGDSAYPGFETATTVRFAAVTATTVTLKASADRVTVGDSVTLSAKASSVPGTLVIRAGSKRIVSSTTGSTSAVVKKLTVGTHNYQATFTPDNSAVYAASTDAVAVTARPETVGVGSLRWGVKQSFREYVTGTIAKGAIAVTGATTSGGEFGFGQASGGTFTKSTGTGTSKYSGSVRFTGHAGLLDLSLSDPTVRIDSATSATLFLRVNGGAASAFATLNLSGGTRSTPNGTVAYTDVPAALTAGGASVFSYKGSSFYDEGTALDPVTFVIGSAKSAPTTSATVAAFQTAPTAAPTVPATEGITVDGADDLVAGDEVTATADGFEPNEQNVLVVIYSDPIVLADNATADASGRVTWTGALPAVLTGNHTLTFQGSVDRGVELTIGEPVTIASADSCQVTDASITWGFKESFRSYISGSIANGKWEVADGATYSVPDFGFADGTGSFDGTAGTIAFKGSIEFTGHDGILDTTVANPTIRIDGDTAILSLDVAGTTQEGEEVSSKAVEFVSLDLASADRSTTDGVTTITAAPASLTAAGSAAFGTYETGEEFDPVDLTFTTPADCGAVAAPVAETPTATADAPIVAQPVASETVPVWAWAIIALLALILAAAIVLIVLTVRRPRAPTATP